MLKNGLIFWWQTTIAFCLCLWIAFELSMDMAITIAVTVCLMADLNTQAVAPLCRWRSHGTILAAVVVALLALPFAQSPWLYIFGLATWTALCGFASIHFHYFPSYAAQFAGITTTILFTANHGLNEHTFQATFSHTAEILLGLIVVAVVFGCFHVRKGVSKIEPPGKDQVNEILQLIRSSLRTTSDEQFGAQMRQWTQHIDALRTKLLLIGEEDRLYLNQANGLRLALTNLFGPVCQLTQSLRSLQQAQHNETRELFEAELISLLNTIASRNDARCAQMAIRNDLPALEKLLSRVLAQENDSALRGHIVSIIPALRLLLERISVYRHTRADPASHPMRHFGKIVDRRIALIFGLGIFFGYLIFSFFWIGSEWELGPISLMIFIAISMLQMATATPVKTAIQMFIGLCLAILFTLPIKFILLPMAEGFIWMAFSASVMLLPGCLIKANHKYAGIGAGYLLFSAMLVEFQNHMNYDMHLYINLAVAHMISVFAAIALMAVIHPWRGTTRLNMLMQRAWVDFESTIAAVSKGNFNALDFWEDRQFDRLRRLDQISGLKEAKEANDAATNFIVLNDCMRRYADEAQYLTMLERSEGFEPEEKLLNSIQKLGHSTEFSNLGSLANDLSTYFRMHDQMHRADAWNRISLDALNLKRMTYAT